MRDQGIGNDAAWQIAVPRSRPKLTDTCAGSGGSPSDVLVLGAAKASIKMMDTRLQDQSTSAGRGKCRRMLVVGNPDYRVKKRRRKTFRLDLLSSKSCWCSKGRHGQAPTRL